MNTEKICRCCLALDVPLLSIYDGGSAGMGCVGDMLRQIAKLKPQPGDKMPEKACLQCISEINRCYVFKMKCENSNRTLRQLLPDAKPELLDLEIVKNVSVASASVQTDDKILTTSTMQTDEIVKPLVSHSSAQTIEEEGPIVGHKEVQTEYEIVEEEFENTKNHQADFVTEKIIIYEEIEKPTKSCKKRLQTSPLGKRGAKKRKSDTVLKSQESPINSQTTDAYILLEDSNIESLSPVEAEAVYNTNSLQQQEDQDNKQRFEYYEEQIEEIPDNESIQNVMFEDDHEYENNLTNNDYEPEEEIEYSQKTIKPTLNTRASNKTKGLYKCSQCIMTFVSIKVLKRHLANRHNIKDADIVIDYLTPLEPDKTAIADEEPSSSDNVASVFNGNISELTAENVAKPQLMPRERVTSSVNEEILPSNIKYFCEFCQAGFAQRKTFTYHMKHQVCMVHNFKCNKCDRIFVSKENLDTHKLTHENPHKCLECDTVCKTMEELSQHMIDDHNRNARNQCHVCKKVFTMKTSLIDHLRVHSGEKPFLCTICGKSFSQNSNLRQHLTRHTNEKNFKCDMCPKAYVTKAELFSHKRTHTGEHPFKCDICEARFTTSCSLQKHLRKHTGERPYACEFCPSRFASLNVLKNHRRIHTGEKPFKCIHCQKSFTQKGDCLMHERSHVNKDFKCFCEARFYKKFNLRNHIKTQHPDFNEKEIQSLLNKQQTEKAEYQITIVERESDGKFVDDVATGNVGSSNNNEDLMQIALEDII